MKKEERKTIKKMRISKQMKEFIVYLSKDENLAGKNVNDFFMDVRGYEERVGFFGQPYLPVTSSVWRSFERMAKTLVSRGYVRRFNLMRGGKGYRYRITDKGRELSLMFAKVCLPEKDLMFEKIPVTEKLSVEEILELDRLAREVR